MKNVSVVIRQDTGAKEITPELVEEALIFYLGADASVTVFYAAKEDSAALRAEVERLKEVKSKAAIVIAGWELMSKTSDYDLGELKEALRKYVNE